MTRASGLSTPGTVVGSSWVAGSPPTGFRRVGHAVLFDSALVGLEESERLRRSVGGLDPHRCERYPGQLRRRRRRSRWSVVRAYRLNLSTGVIDDLSGGWQGSTFANGINADGHVAGWGYTNAGDTGQAAFVYTDLLGFKKLNDMIDPASGWDLRVATSINA